MLNRVFVNRRGLSLMELLVVIGIIAVLISLILPAVQSARQAAARTQAESSLKQLVLASSSFQTSHGGFPPGSVTRPFAGSPAPTIPANGTVQHGWLVFLLPQLEQENLAAQYDFASDWASVRNQGVVQTPMKLLISPMVPSGNRVGVLSNGRLAAASDYHPVRGVGAELMEPYPEWGGATVVPRADYTGIFGENRLTRPAEISDGLSNTVMFIESAGGPDLYRLGVAVPGASSTGYSPFDPKSAFLVHGTCDLGGHFPGPFWNASNLGGPDGEAYGFHPNIVLAGMADGSVRKLQKSLDIRVFVRLVGMKDGMSLGGD